MDLAKQYIVQCITTAANNLRLSSSKIEMVALLREHLEKSENLSEEIKYMKQITEFSKFSIKLGQIHTSLENNKIDFLKISEKYKVDSYGLVKELSNLLDILTPEIIRKKIKKVEPSDINIDIDLSKRASKYDILEKISTSDFSSKNGKGYGNELSGDFKEKYILGELNDSTDINFEHFEETMLKHIRPLDIFLNRLSNYDYESGEIIDYIRMMKSNAELSNKIGFEILHNMHRIFYKGLELVHEKKIAPSNEVIA